ncbi:uncharacterized protein BCR38DRAFT_101578 [Pseudomassariella vexata]|uniref:Uncharacterized protein n=1 Tax=Pseudomassariella vexata TaxID=1141098 RepID=A0A1Y2EF56_9PEZI|nr:uncharacterized protein BCR38DRAFT_101578 [Pseudomassariella vexata]ORY70189.1 hypothetical protein BCR38DRAFT_101578 [Pseudomassariella vexata]
MILPFRAVLICVNETWIYKLTIRKLIPDICTRLISIYLQMSTLTNDVCWAAHSVLADTDFNLPDQHMTSFEGGHRSGSHIESNSQLRRHAQLIPTQPRTPPTHQTHPVLQLDQYRDLLTKASGDVMVGAKSFGVVLPAVDRRQLFSPVRRKVVMCSTEGNEGNYSP